MNKKGKLKHKRQFYIALLAVVISIVSMAVATFAWYIYNTNATTTKVQLAAGSSVSLSISNKIDGTYASTTVLDAFSGKLNPVSTNKIANGFQKVSGYTNGTPTQPTIVANLFGPGEYSDYYKTSVFFKTDGDDLDLSINDIVYNDKKATKPISTAIRVGIVVVDTGKEFIFSINDASNPKAEYNTQNGVSGHVLDSTKTDGTTVKFVPYNNDNYSLYDSSTGDVDMKPNTIKFTEVGKVPIQIDIYVWLEGCDEDCAQNLSSSVLQNLAISFTGTKDK